MTKEVEILINLAKERLRRKVSKQEVLYTFIKAGILNSKSQFTKNYPYLAAKYNTK